MISCGTVQITATSSLRSQFFCACRLLDDRPGDGDHMDLFRAVVTQGFRTLRDGTAGGIDIVQQEQPHSLQSVRSRDRKSPFDIPLPLSGG